MPNVYVTKYFDPNMPKSAVKRLKVRGHIYRVKFIVDDAWYKEVRITDIPAETTMDALENASHMLDKCLPGATPSEVEYAQTR